MTTVRFAAIQMTTGVGVDANLQIAAELIEKAAREGAQLIVLPENFAAMGLREADRCALAEPDGHGPLQAFLCTAGGSQQCMDRRWNDTGHQRRSVTAICFGAGLRG